MSNINHLIQESILGKIGKVIAGLTLGGVALYYFLTNKGELTPEFKEVLKEMNLSIKSDGVKNAINKVLETPPKSGDIRSAVVNALKELKTPQKDIDTILNDVENMALGAKMRGKLQSTLSGSSFGK